jgi:aspartyl-tRNA(Asn)/glutamyl-tRNA(Gln) amidotransferase subunit C
MVGCYDSTGAFDNQMAQTKITVEQVRHVARLARLQLDPKEEERLQAEMSEMLAYVDQLNQLDTGNVEPTAQVGESGTPMRDDIVTNEPAAEAMLANAPARKGTFFKVPKIIE